MLCRLLLLVLAGCGRIQFGTVIDASDSAREDGLDGAPDDTVTSTGSFGTPQVVAELASPSNEVGPAIGSNGLQLHFATDRAGGYTIWLSKRATTADRWGAPTRVVGLDAAGAIEFDPELTQDGLEMIYATDANPQGLRQLTRVSDADPWPAPGTSLSFGTPRLGPSLSNNELRLFMRSAVGLEERTRSMPGATWTSVRQHATLADYHSPGISSDGLEVYVTSASQQLFLATRLSINDQFGPPERVLFGSPFDDAMIADPELSADGRTLWLAIQLPGGDYDIYEATR